MSEFLVNMPGIFIYYIGLGLIIAILIMSILSLIPKGRKYIKSIHEGISSSESEKIIELNNQIKTLDKKLDKRIKALKNKNDAQIKILSDKLDKIVEKLSNKDALSDGR